MFNNKEKKPKYPITTARSRVPEVTWEGKFVCGRIQEDKTGVYICLYKKPNYSGTIVLKNEAEIKEGIDVLNFLLPFVVNSPKKEPAE